MDTEVIKLRTPQVLLTKIKDLEEAIDSDLLNPQEYKIAEDRLEILKANLDRGLEALKFYAGFTSEKVEGTLQEGIHSLFEPLFTLVTFENKNAVPSGQGFYRAKTRLYYLFLNDLSWEEAMDLPVQEAEREIKPGCRSGLGPEWRVAKKQDIDWYGGDKSLTDSLLNQPFLIDNGDSNPLEVQSSLSPLANSIFFRTPTLSSSSISGDVGPILNQRSFYFAKHIPLTGNSRLPVLCVGPLADRAPDGDIDRDGITNEEDACNSTEARKFAESPERSGERRGCFKNQKTDSEVLEQEDDFTVEAARILLERLRDDQWIQTLAMLDDTRAIDRSIGDSNLCGGEKINISFPTVRLESPKISTHPNHFAAMRCLKRLSPAQFEGLALSLYEKHYLALRFLNDQIRSIPRPSQLYFGTGIRIGELPRSSVNETLVKIKVYTHKFGSRVDFSQHKDFVPNPDIGFFANVSYAPQHLVEDPAKQIKRIYAALSTPMTKGFVRFLNQEEFDAWAFYSGGRMKLVIGLTTVNMHNDELHAVETLDVFLKPYNQTTVSR